jgi:hypothetical protein
MRVKRGFWDTLSRIRNACWAIGVVSKAACLVLTMTVLILGFIQGVPVAVIIPAVILTIAGTGVLALVIDMGARRWLPKSLSSPLSERTKLLCTLRDEAKHLRDKVNAREGCELSVNDSAFNTIWHEFPQRLRMYAGGDSERDYRYVVGTATKDSENIKVAANVAYATIEQITALTIRHEHDQLAVSHKT